MGKKKAEEMAKQRSVFVDGACARGVEARLAAHIFDLMEKFAGYGFNKSHSAAYALLSYQTAYLKAHYPAAFMAAVLSADMDHTDKIVTLIDECAHIGLTVLPPDINSSSYMFAVADERTIRYGLGAIKGVGRSAVEAIVGERERQGPYKSLVDVCRRIDLSRLSRRVFEALIRSGSLDGLGPNRATLMGNLEQAMAASEQSARSDAGERRVIGQVRLKRRHRHEALQHGTVIRSIVRLPVVLRFLDPKVRPPSGIETPIDFGDVIAPRLHGRADAGDWPRGHIDVEKRPGRQGPLQQSRRDRGRDRGRWAGIPRAARDLQRDGHRRIPQERALERTRHRAGVRHVVTDVQASVDAGDDERRRPVEHFVDRDVHAVGGRAVHGVDALAHEVEAQRTPECQGVPDSARLGLRRDDRDRSQIA
jgi:hypothetical protein